MFSLVSGTYRQAKRFGGQSQSTLAAGEDNTSAVALRNPENALAVLPDSAASEYCCTLYSAPPASLTEILKRPISAITHIPRVGNENRRRCPKRARARSQWHCSRISDGSSLKDNVNVDCVWAKQFKPVLVLGCPKFYTSFPINDSTLTGHIWCNGRQDRYVCRTLSR